MATPTAADIANTWPWAQRLSELVSQDAPRFRGSHLIVASDYSGSHAASRFIVYSFAMVDADSSPSWPQLRLAFRRSLLPDGRRLSFKSLNDGQRRRALGTFLKMADSFHGQLVSIVVHKELARMSSGATTLDLAKRLHSLEGRWNDSSFEAVARVAHLFGVLVAAWSLPMINVSWLTDQDDIVANTDRHSDLLKLAAWFSGLYSPHRFGELAIVTTASDSGRRELEDFAALPDLAAGALAEATTRWSGEGFTAKRELSMDGLSTKSEAIVNWLATGGSRFRRVVMIVDRVEPGRFVVVPLRFGDSAA